MRPTPARAPQPAHRALARLPAGPAAALVLPLDSIEALLNDMATVQERGTLPRRREGKLGAQLQLHVLAQDLAPCRFLIPTLHRTTSSGEPPRRPAMTAAMRVPRGVHLLPRHAERSFINLSKNVHSSPRWPPPERKPKHYVCVPMISWTPNQRQHRQKRIVRGILGYNPCQSMQRNSDRENIDPSPSRAPITKC